MKKYLERKSFIKYSVSILVPVLLLTAVFFIVTSRNMVRLYTDNMKLQTEESAENIDTYMKDVIKDMEEVRELIERNCDTDAEVFDFVRSTENYGVFDGVYTGDNTGFYVGSTPWDIPEDYDPTTRPWYIDGKDSRDFVFGEPYLDASINTMCVSISARMDAGDDSVVRVVASDIYLDYMNNLMKEVVENSDIEGAVLVTGENDTILADSTGKYTGETMTESSELYAFLYNELLGKGSGLHSVSNKNGRYYAAIKEVPSTGWYLIVYENRNLILHDLHITELIMIIFSIVVVVFIAYTMRRYGKEVSKVEQQANRAKTEFISRISHDIRTPIGQVLNLTEFAKEDKNNPEKLDEDLDRIDSSGRFLLSLINDVLDVSQIESGLMEMHPAVTSYSDYMKDIKNIMIPLCENKGLTCEFKEQENEDELPNLYVDDVRLKQITLNLISNAVKYTPKGGKITYISESNRGENGGLDFGFTLKDTGMGMTPEFMEHMFERFTRDTENKLRDNSQMGSGLGLYLVKNMIEIMGGQISYDSEVGKGTSVKVRIKLDKAPEIDEETDVISEEETEEEVTNQSSTVKDNVKKKQYNGKVLLAEDNEINTEIALRLLTGLGLDVDCAVNGAECIDKFKDSVEGYYKIIFMDIQMPVMDGYEATREIRKLNRKDAGNVPIVAMTADAFKDAKEESTASGMTGFITKPLIIKEICDILDELE